MPQEIGVDDAKLGLDGGKIEVLLPKAFEEGAGVSDVSRGVGVEDDDVVEVGGDAFEVFDDLVDYLDEPPGRGVATLRHDEPLKRREGVQKVVSGMVSLSMVVWWNEDARSNREYMRPFPRESRTSSTRGMGRWPRKLMILSFL